MVINMSHSEHVKNRNSSENHVKKILSFADSNTDGGLKATTTDLRCPDIIQTAQKWEEPQVVGNGMGSFVKKKFDIVRHEKGTASVGLDKLKEMVKSGKPADLGNSNDLDYLMWVNEPKELAMSVNFAQMLNFKDIGTDLNVQVVSILESEGANSPIMKFDRTLSYDLFRQEETEVVMVPTAHTKDGPRGDMVKLVNQNSHAIGLSQSIAGKAVGVEMELMNGRSATKMNAIRNRPTDMRQMALKAVLLKLQLTMAHASEPLNIDFESVPFEYEAERKTVTEALSYFPSHDIIIDITKLSDEQREILLVLCSAWPSQRLTNDNRHDIYSALNIAEEEFVLYTSNRDPVQIRFNGIQMHPKAFWAQCVQLFMNLGGLDDLIEVTRDTRGLAPILVHNACRYGRRMSVVSHYPVSSCYYGLNTQTVPNRRYVAPTILESSTLVLLVDNMMLSLYLNNMLYLSENLGLGSKTIFPSFDGDHNTKVLDVLTCFNMTSGNANGSLMSYACPWLCPLGKFHTSGLKVLMIMANDMRLRRSNNLVCCSLNYQVPTKMRVSSATLVKGTQEVDVSKLMGFQSKTKSTGPTIQLVNWYNAVSGDRLPCFGPSAQGAKLRGDELPMLKEIHAYKGNYKIVRVMAITEYEPQRTGEGTLRNTFFQNPQYMEAVAPQQCEEKMVQYKQNSFNVQGLSDMEKAGLTTTVGVPKWHAHYKQIVDYIKGMSVDSPASKGTFVTQPTASTNDSGSNILSSGQAPESSGSSVVSEPINAGILEMSTVSKCDIVEQPMLTKSGNCGVEALKYSIPNMDIGQALSTLGVTVNDAFWLAADDLAKIADNYGRDLMVVTSNGGHEWYSRTGAGKRPCVAIYQESGHFKAMRPTGTCEQKKVLKVLLEPAPSTEEGRLAMRRKIETGQQTRGSVPNPIK
uniref:Uncharacterized protein n=1 Tax=Keturi virus TaxID=2800922 RepID=A0A894KQP1_9VIRU|nr:MAG: hypothetical protein [Keturi virus]